MKILIVDDNQNNRALLHLLIQEYREGKNAPDCDILECNDGLEALEQVKKQDFNLIFMDIIMPGMDGIEATKKIREINKEVMIIAVSAVEDESRKKEILRIGAEDYILKPIDTQQLYERLDNYLPLLRLRHQTNMSENRKAVNLFTKEIYHRQTIFYVSSEEALSEFWEYYLLAENPWRLDNLSDVVRTIFSLGEAMIQLGEEPWIIVEADQDASYFTLNKVDVLGVKLVRLIIRKNGSLEGYKIEHNRVSFRLARNSMLSEDITPPAANEMHVNKEVEQAPPQQADVPENFADVSISKTDVETYRVYHFMDTEDLSEAEDVLGDLSSLMLIIGSSEVQIDEVHTISVYLERLGRYLSIYSESYFIGMSLINLSQEIQAHDQRFLEIAQDLSALSVAFISDLRNWFDMMFVTGAPSVDFMNDTISANVQLIVSMLADVNSDVSEESMDDIFDF